MNRTLLSHFTGLRSLLGRALPALLAITVMAATGALAGIAHAAATVDTIVVKIRDDALPPDARVLPVEFGDLLGAAAAVSLAQIGVERDGAFRLRLTQPLPFVEARAAVNRVRMLPQVLYAQLPDPTVPSASPFLVPGAAQPPVTKMIVKYRDPALSWLSDRGGALDAAQLNRLSVAAGQSFANERAMSGGAFVVRLFQPIPANQAQALVQSLESVPEIEYAEPDLRMYPTVVPNDSLYGSQQWDLKPPAQSAGGANLPPAWDITTGSSAVRIAVLDTGILPHPDLIGRYLAGYDMIADALVGNDGNGRDSDPTDPGDWITLSENQEPGGYFQGCRVGSSSWHGTHVAGTIGASSNNAQGIAGINWVSQIVPVRVLGKCGGYTSDIADAMRWAAGLTVTGVPGNPNPARVISLSLGGGGACGTTFQNAINAALAAGSLFTIAAGNDNADAKDFSPGNCAGVITVAATQAAGARASYSNHGATVDIAAPGGGDGVGIVSTLNSGTTTANPSGYIYVGYQGTSMATPHLAGIASLMLSANSTLTPAQVLSTIQTTARAFPTGTGRDCTSDLGSVTGTIKYCGAGIVDAGAAVAAVAGGPGATTTQISSSANPAAAGVLVTFTASVTGTLPTGTVTFRDGGVTIATCSAAPLAGVGSTRTATCGISTLATGVHSIVATYNGDAGNATSSSPPLSQTITGAAGSTSTVVASSANPSPLGASVTFTASVTGTLPTGTVTFRDGGVTIATCSAAPLAGVGNTRTATCGISTLATGVHSIVATYNGDAGNAASSSPPLSQTITGAAGSTSTVVTSSANPSQLGASVTFTASVTGTSPTGTVRFLQGNLMIPGCTAVALTGSGNTRTALCSTAALPLGNTLIRAFYFGDAGNSASNGQVVQTVQASTGSATTTVVTTSGTPSIAGTTVTFTASVTGNAPTGTVSFTDAGSAIAGCPAVPLSGTGNTRTAQCATSALAVGSHTVAASYGGDGGNLASSGSVTQVVQAGGGTPTTTTLATSGTPSTAGASVTFTASVTGVAPTGNVAFTDNGSPITACAFVALTGTGNTRTAQCALGTLTVGTHTISGNYAGDLANLASSGSVTQVVNAGGGGTNVALASAGAVATASSTMAATYPTSALNNNERAGVGFGAGGVWTDGTMNALPDWVQISFGTTRTIDRVVVYSVQDNYLAPVEPTDTLTFTTRGLTAFAVQGWNGSAWVDLATVSGNNLVKRTTTFAAYTTSAIRINVTGTRGGKTYMTEVEAWGN